MSKYKLMLMMIMALCLITASFSGCLAGKSSKSHWFIDENGHFHTDNITLAQKQIPFTIVIPKYIPDVFGIDYQYEITGPFKNILPNNIEVKIQYTDVKHQIYISEYNIKEIMSPNQELKPVYYEIASIQVLKQIAGFTTGSGRIEGWGYYWNTDNLTFDVETINIPEEEGIKLVESMIKQMKQ